MLQDPKHTGGPSTSNRHEGQAEYLVQAGYVSGGITINTVNSPRRRWPWRLLGVVGATVLIGYLVLRVPGDPPPAGIGDPPTGNPPAETVQLRSRETNLCAAIAEDSVVKQLPCNGASPPQLWNIDDVDRDPGDLRMFSQTRGEYTKFCLELPGLDPQPPGTQVTVAHCNSNRREDNQLWHVESGEPNYIRIRNDLSNDRCLSPVTKPGSPLVIKKPGSPLVIKDCAGGGGSQWEVIRRKTAP